MDCMTRGGRTTFRPRTGVFCGKLSLRESRSLGSLRDPDSGIQSIIPSKELQVFAFRLFRTVVDLSDIARSLSAKQDSRSQGPRLEAKCFKLRADREL